MKQLIGSLSIGNPQGGRHDGKEVITIEVTDELSGARFLDVEIDPAEMMLALRGRARTPCKFILRPLLVGCKFEHKTERVPFDKYSTNKDEIAAALAPYEIDGWCGNRDDMTNGHRSSLHDGARTQTVSFRRYIGLDGKPVELTKPTGEQGAS